MSNDVASMPGPWTILRLLRWTTQYLQGRDIHQARSDAEILLSHVLACQRIDLYLRYDQPLVDQELQRFKALIKQRAARCPTAYILGSKEFWSLEFSVSPDVLIPRPETECLVEQVLKNHGPHASRNVLELGTGSGAIVVTLASERPDWTFMATDVSTKALAVAQKNAARHGVADRIAWESGSWFAPIAIDSPRFDLIVSNPPYIASAAVAGLAPEISAHEPVNALDGGERGLDCIEHLIRTSPDYLAPGGELVLEIGSDQRAAVQRLARERGAYRHISVFRDYGGLDRVARLQLTVN